MKEWGIQTRILFFALVPLTLIVALLSFHFIQTRLDDLDQALQDRGKAIARQMAPACEYGVFSGNSEFLAGLARSVLRENDVLSVTISDMQDSVLAHASRKDWHPENPTILGRAASVYTFQAPILQSEVKIDDFYDVANSDNHESATGGQSRQLGTITVELSNDTTITQRNQFLAESLLIIMIGLAMTTIIALRMARSVTKPILSLTSLVRQIKTGGLDQRVAVESGGELGTLERGINAMVEALERGQEADKRRAEDALYLEKVRAQVTLESIGDGVITTDQEGKIVYLNPVAAQFTGWDAKAAEGLWLKEVFKTVDETSSRPRDYPLHLCLRDGNVIRHDSHHLQIGRAHV